MSPWTILARVAAVAIVAWVSEDRHVHYASGGARPYAGSPSPDAGLLTAESR